MNDDGLMVRQDVDAVERGAMDKLPMIRRLAAEIKEQAAGYCHSDTCRPAERISRLGDPACEHAMPR